MSAFFRPVVALTAFALVSCGGGTAPRYEDLVAFGGLISNQPAVELRQATCADRTLFAQAVRPGEELTARIVLGEAPRLVVSGCRTGEGAGGELAVAVAEAAPRAASSAPLRMRIAWGDGGGWWRREIDLAPLAGRTINLRLDGVAEDGILWLSDLVVEHRTAAPERPSHPAPHQVLLISVDTLRADSVRALGGPWTTPTLDRLAGGGEAFDRHYAASSWTKPSHAGLLTGMPAEVHRATGFEDPLHPAVPTLAERFRDAGFATAGIVHDCVWLDPKFGFDRGFDEYRSVKWGGDPIVRGAVNWMAAHRDRPFFFFLHTFDVHSDFARLPYEGPETTRATVAERFGAADYGCRLGHCSSGLLEQLGRRNLGRIENEREILRFLYGRGIAGVDAALGRLFADLERAGLYDDLLIVLTADHGESLLEEGRTLHGSWFEEVVRVPLIVKWPGGARAGRRTPGPSSALDVAPTLLAASGIPADAGELPGEDLRLPARADRPVVVAATWRALIEGRRKLVVEPGQAPKLYDLDADPGESRDVAATDPAGVAALGTRLDTLRADGDRHFGRLAASAAAAAKLTDEERARLRALGYLGGGGG